MGLTQEELAERTGLSARSIGNLEAGRIDAPRPATVRLLADAFGLADVERDRFCQAAAGQVTAGPVTAWVPAQLPPDVSAFVGRDEQLAWLDASLSAATDTSTAVVISAIAGTPGVGKTALAVHWAHRVRERFPDGQLYVNLRGHDPDQPVAAEDVLARFLTALGVSGPDIPFEVDERAARYRTELAGRRMLIVLDNAASVEQVRPLLPGTPTCVVVVASRDSLAGLVAMHGARRLGLDLLAPTNAVVLLRTLIGPRADLDADATAALADLCGRLPLALRIVAELAVSRPATPLAHLVSELADRQRRLELLHTGGDPRAAVAAVFSWSIRHLPPHAARAFRLLGLHPGSDVDPYAVAALTETDLPQARGVVDLLVRAHLMHPTSPDRHGMHDLLRAYAMQLTTAHDSSSNRTAALGRLFDYYLTAAAVAMDRLHPANTHHRPPAAPARTPVPDLTGPDTARQWLDTERTTLTAVTAYTAAHGWHSHAIPLSATLFHYLDGGHHTDAIAVHGHAYHAAQQAGDLAGQAQALLGVGTAYSGLGQYEPAADHLQQALTLFRQTGDQTGQTRARIILGYAERRRGRYSVAADHHRQALALARQTGDQSSQARALTNLGSLEMEFGRYESAVQNLEQALTLSRQIRDQTGEARALNNLALVEVRMARYAAAVAHVELALEIVRQTGDLRGEAYILGSLGTVHTRLGQFRHATGTLQQALTLFREFGDRNGEAWVHTRLGDVAHATGHAADALAHHGAAYAIATRTDDHDLRARVHTGLGHTYQALGDPTRAREHYEQALAFYIGLGSAEAGAVRGHLRHLTQPTDSARTTAEGQ